MSRVKNSRNQKNIYLLTLCFLFSLSGEAIASACSDSADPTRTESVEGADFMVAAAHPLAVEAGCEVLADGGTAIDAAIAVQAVLTVVEPELRDWAAARSLPTGIKRVNGCAFLTDSRVRPTL